METAAGSDYLLDPIEGTQEQTTPKPIFYFPAIYLHSDVPYHSFPSQACTMSHAVLFSFFFTVVLLH